MIPAASFIYFADLTPDAIVLWASDSIEDCLGYAPEEVVGITAYNFLFKEDVPVTRTSHQEHLLNDFVASQAILGYLRKDGGRTLVEVVYSTCHDFITCCVIVLEAEDTTYMAKLQHNASLTFNRTSRSKQFERLRRHRTAFKAGTWDTSDLLLEPRVCVILNRFTRSLDVMYASPSCELLLHIDSQEIEGKPFLLFIRADDLASFVENMDVAKSTNIISHIRFWFQSPHWPQEIPCEALLVGTSDGLVLIMQLCRPFVRRRLIGSMRHYDARKHPELWESYAAGSLDSQIGWSSSPASVSPSPPSMDRHSTGGGLVDSPPRPGKFRRIVELNEDEEELGEDEEDVMEVEFDD
ncbi:hypothetical protein BGZ67_000236 [Mortierella alpina]|nr:hypothetical protein BGZ67_000236 [Mortierella alpina]